MLCKLRPRFRRGVFLASARLDCGGIRRLVDLTGAEFDESWRFPPCAFPGKVDGQLDRTGFVYGVFLGVACFAAAVEDVGVFPPGTGSGWGEDFDQGFCHHGSVIGVPMLGREAQDDRTFSACIRLHEVVGRAGFQELGGQPSQLWKDFVDQPDGAGKLIPVDVKGKEAADVP